MDYALTSLRNGLRVITVPLANLESATITIWVGVGSRSESDKIAGLSHFLEHMVFKGSQKRPSAKAIATAIDAIGGEFNAATSKEWTNFYIKAAKTHLPLAFDVLADMVLNPLLDEKEIEREKGVILEEMAMYEDTPIMKIGDVFEELIFKGNSLGRDTVGTEKAVKSLKKADFERYRNRYYYAENIVVSVAGGIKEKEAIELAKKHFGGLKSAKGNIPFNFAKFGPAQKKPQLFLKSKQNEQAHLILGFRAGKRGNSKRFIEAVLAAILGGGMSSRLFTEIRERRGLAYSVKTSVDHYFEVGEFASYAGVEVKKAEEAIRVMLREHYGIANGQLPISNTELTKAKEYLKGHIALALEDTKDVNGLFGEEELMQGKIETPQEIFAGIDKVKLADITALAKEIFVPSRLNLAIIGPFKDKSKFEKILQ